MTTVTIGKKAEQPAAPVPAEKKEEQTLNTAPKEPENTGRPYVKYFSAPEPAGKHIPLRGVFIVQLLICAAAGAFVWLGTISGSDELRGALTEAVLGALNG